MEIRDYDDTRDRDAVRACFLELQDFERALDSRMPAGEQIADAYLELMWKRCREFDGAVLVADSEGSVVGFVTVWARYRSSEPDDDPAEFGFISDLVVLASHRGQGFGRALLHAAEARARETGAPAIRLSVKAGNTGAEALYRGEGFANAELYLEKSLNRPRATRARLVVAKPFLFVSDINAACDFYVGRLGFDVAFRYGGDPPFYAEIRRDGVQLALRLADESDRQPPRERRKEQELLSATILVNDPRLLFEDYEAAGATFHKRLVTEPWGKQGFIVEDPDGNLVSFAEL